MTPTATVESGRRIIRGIASSINEDRHGDIVMPRGLKWGALPLPLLWQHSHSDVVGKITEITATASDVRIVAEVGRGFGRADEVFAMIREGYAAGLSIGFIGKKHEANGARGLKWLEAELLEVSVVSVASNRESRILDATGKAQATKQGEAVLLLGHPRYEQDRWAKLGHAGAVSLKRATR